MSYNISSFKIKKLLNLRIPISAFYKHPRKDWHPNRHDDFETGLTTLECGCDQEIIGKVEDGILTVTELDMRGEGSGTFWYWIFEPALKESDGVLEAVIIWEGGDSVTKLLVYAGKVEHDDYEL